MFIKLQISDVLKMSFPAIEFDAEFDDARAVISTICEELDDLGNTCFEVSGFGETSWPVDVATDLATLIEQLPEALAVLEQGDGEFRIDFYEQGIERLIFGQVFGESTKLRCQSRTNWEPVPSEIEMRSGDLAAMLSSVLRQFLSVAMATPMPDNARKALAAWSLPRRIAA